MSENDKKNRNEDPNDPFNFFNRGQDTNSPNDKEPKHKKPLWLIIAGVFIALLFINQYLLTRTDNAIPFSEFKDRIESGEIVRVRMGPSYFYGYTKSKENTNTNPSFYSLFNSTDDAAYQTVGVLSDGFLKLLDDRRVIYSIKPQERNYLFDILQYLFPILILVLIWRFFFKRMTSGMNGLGGSIFSAGQARSAAVEEGKVTTRFSDVAGVDEAKEELMEVVDFLKYPKKYTEIGGKIPRGVLLVGPPGTGKTLLARAVAGEAGVPFFRISGSDFVEMFVGVGASRVRDLFKQAREKAPCIIFIDELDAIGKSRINSINSNDEREQTLNQLLVEMDGFDNTTGLILLAATNRPDVLDPALLRPGRFDRQVVVDRPDVKGREAILKIHAKNVKLSPDVDLKAVARITSGYSGADLANVINEAALLAVRSGRKVVINTDLDEAVEKAMIGLQKKSRVIREEERRVIAYHETGHALVSTFTDGADQVHKITIIPRGTSTLGYTFHIPEDDKHIVTQKQLLAEVDVLLGGRAAEDVTFNEISTGAGNDISRASDIIRGMITDYGMSDKFKNVALTKRGSGYGAGDPQLVREYSESTQQYVDEEVARVMEERYQRVTNLLTEKKDLLTYIAERLLEKETIEFDEYNEIIKAEGNLSSLNGNGKEEAETPLVQADEKPQNDASEI
ncbi:ATP-dependent metallopeptidase FtsH/Yme1/Tma family protein [Treponema phagedenis]|uniref:ATP-dependent zinc metalloprotease FtsH n=1 Tax=Treponema phagedenis TaxID=162 RepID=A0A0B7GPU4_TREPH|nr:ATP-dependent zinc metalloprotease FtsH [Treponema phagedenis]NVP23279.1 ATP-dependent metallopeptidase FtsH/Yme1/Tma family protein [Treponema phagedenis]QEJ95367.1 ATP-dependent metallopeptidase FtsH/Yme1/Tma family protein [Treponema phagedenis]QEJ97919.1 ATP-dependent metallopeptidase FtsH/Yme1/Tma family protein [Treponema phagedenis]QEK01220.1 ATP-dependent metallopeptidase FtsH/Yme1/Tma family protein [Treponema phagedenis]QEK03486.1 ATP-dependent metallopeptidase FtsH/Yme1/Tma famil